MLTDAVKRTQGISPSPATTPPHPEHVLTVDPDEGEREDQEGDAASCGTALATAREGSQWEESSKVIHDKPPSQPPANRLQTKLGFVTLLAEVMHMGEPAEKMVLTIPVSVFESAETKEELEDWLAAHDPVFIDEMRRIKADADAGLGRPLSDLAKKWNIDL